MGHNQCFAFSAADEISGSTGNDTAASEILYQTTAGRILGAIGN